VQLPNPLSTVIIFSLIVYNKGIAVNILARPQGLIYIIYMINVLKRRSFIFEAELHHHNKICLYPFLSPSATVLTPLKSSFITIHIGYKSIIAIGTNLGHMITLSHQKGQITLASMESKVPTTF
jgi:hypothetical protein